MIVIDSVKKVTIKNELGKTIMSIDNPSVEIEGNRYNHKVKDEKGNTIIVDEYRNGENKC